MNYAKIRKLDVANGEGIGVSLFVQGCHFHCKNCFNKVTWDFDSGKQFTKDPLNTIISLLTDEHIKRFSILGGEPMDAKNQETTLEIIKAVKKAYGDTKDVWIWTGYVVDKNLPQTSSTKQILSNADVIVDGPFIIEEQDVTLPYAGSKNQRVLHRGKDF